ncbi:MAG: hypothetical protein K0Q79_748 [Flavipsychrobacter sp.]|jgi:hypothetical protein|nr:hypothetical protein [Flavipsychrobacter sp.]
MNSAGRITAVLILCFSFLGDAKGQDSAFYLEQIKYNSDFNFHNIISKVDTCAIDSIKKLVLSLEVGRYTVYVFEREISGISHDDNPNIRQELIIMKVIKNTIVESYYFPLNWREPPVSAVILGSQKKVKIKDKLSTDSLSLKPISTSEINILTRGNLIFKPKL